MMEQNTNELPELFSPNSGRISSDEGDSKDATDNLTSQQAWCLYLSHFLSMWTSRLYEFAAIIFIQRTFPGDLLPSSINGIAETLSVLAFSAALGRWVDANPTRLRPLLLSIVVNRSAIVLCCALWLVVFFTTSGTIHRVLFAVILLLGMVEKTSKMTNMLAFEREWIPTVAGYSTPASIADRNSYDLTHINTIIRRIDIICKLVAPLAVSGTMTLVDPWLTAFFLGIVGSMSCLLEGWSALFVWRSNRLLQPNKTATSSTTYTGRMPASLKLRILSSLSLVRTLLYAQVQGFGYYFSTGIWIPSAAMSVMHGSVLAWSGTLITWLLNYGFSYNQVTVSRGIGVLFEFCSTVVFTWSIAIMTRRSSSTRWKGAYQVLYAKDDCVEMQEMTEDETPDSQLSDTVHDYNALFPVIITAKWSIIGLFIFLVPTLAALFALDNKLNILFTPSSLLHRSDNASLQKLDPLNSATSLSIVFLAFLSLSFLGRWTYDLSVVQLTQITIPSGHRSEFGGAEMALTSLFSLGHWIAAAIWHRQEDFKWLASGSVGIVTIATTGYLIWTLDWQRRITR